MVNFFGSLRLQVILLLALAVLPLAGLAVYLAIDDGRRAAAEAQVAAHATVQLVSQDLNRMIQSSRDLVQGVGQNPLFRDARSCGALLASLKPAFPQFSNLTVTGPGEQIVCTARSPGDAGVLPRTAGNRAVLDHLRQSPGIAIGFVEVSPGTGHSSIPIAGPIAVPPGAPQLVFVAALDLTWLQDELNAIHIAPDAVLLVLDKHGTLMARNPRDAELPPGLTSPLYERTLTADFHLDGEIQAEGGISRLYAISRVGPSADLAVVMKIPSASVYQPSRRRLALHLGALGVVSVLVLGLAWFGSYHYFAAPLSLLIRVANRLAEGNLSARSGVEYTGEIGGLARSLDLMAAALQQERTQRIRSAEAFQSIVEGTSAITGQEFFRSLVRNLTRVLGADFALVGELTENRRALSTLAICSGSKILDNRLYDLSGTRSENEEGKGISRNPVGIQDLFPCDSMLRELSAEGYLGAPLLDGVGRQLGMIAVLKRRQAPDEILHTGPMLEIFAARAAAELERLRTERALRASMERNEEMVSALRALMARLESIREEERTRIAREIHDELGQQLTAMRFDLQSLKKALEIPGQAYFGPLLNRVNDLISLVDSTIGDVRRIATELRPGVLDTFGLVAAIQWQVGEFEKRTGIHSRYEGPEELETSKELATTLFRICQESLTNIARHSHATTATVLLESEDGWISLEIRDNGAGFSSDEPRTARSLGLLGMQERARIAGGTLKIVSNAGRGARVLARLPLSPSVDPTAETETTSSSAEFSASERAQG